MELGITSDIALVFESVLLALVVVLAFILIASKSRRNLVSFWHPLLIVLGIASFAVILLAWSFPSIPLVVLAQAVGALGIVLASRFSISNDNERRIAELAAAKAELAQQKNATLVSQIKPHFIQNSLLTIAYLCEENPPVAKELTLDFARYLRGNIDSVSGADLIPFSKELGHTKAYLAIEKARFGDTFQVIYDIQEEDFLVPPLSIQPLVENAFKHGISPLSEGGTIWISTKKVDDCYHIIIRDNGVGFDPEAEPEDSKTHVGVSNTRNRVSRLLGGILNVKTGSGFGTEITIELPIDQNQEATH